MGRRINALGFAVAAVFLLGAPMASATSAISDYLLIGTGDQSDVGTAVDLSNVTLGTNGGSEPGDIAITDTGGNFKVSNVDIFGTTGIDCAGSLGNCKDGNSNSDFNNSNLTNSNGINGNVNLSNIDNTLAAAASNVPSLVGDFNIMLSFNDGKWDSDLSITLGSGLTVFDFDTNGNDLKIDNDDLLIDGPADAFAVFRIPHEANFLVSNGTMEVGDSGIGNNQVLFYTDKPDDNQHISMSNATIEGISFADLGSSGGEINFSNVDGCTQLIADKINLSNVNLTNCGGAIAAVPEPNVALLLALGLTALGLHRRLH